MVKPAGKPYFVLMANSDETKIARLSSRTVLRLSGPDRVSFLQNLVSQDMALAERGQPLFTCLLTPQGKYLFDFFVLPEEDALLLDIEADRAGDFIDRLGKYRLRADVNLEPLGDECAIFALWDRKSGDARAFADPRLPALGQRIVAGAHHLPAVNARESDYREHRYRHGIPEGGHEIAVGGASLLELNFDVLNGVSFSKGCYLGQELTARTHYRGLVKRRYLPFGLEGVLPEKFGTILHGGFEIGVVRAVGELYGLGLFNLSAVKPFLHGEETLIHDNTTYQVYVPDWLKEAYGKAETAE